MSKLRSLVRTLPMALALCPIVASVVVWPKEAITQTGRCAIGQATPTTIDFDNQSSSSVSLHWVDDQCEEKFIDTLDPRASRGFRTYAKISWRVRSGDSKWLLREATAGTTPLTVRISDLAAPLVRTLEDRPDDVLGYQVQVLYVLPSDGEDRRLDTNGAISLSIAAMQNWFVQQTGGKRFRLDTYEGALDITFVRLSQLGADLRRHGDYIRDEIEKELRARGFNHPDKIYTVYYDGDATVCGNAVLTGNVAAQYLRGTPEKGGRCDSTPLAKSVTEPKLWEYSVAHEILHALGFVAPCAQHITRGAHVSDSQNDLMYAGDEDWLPTTLDVKKDDYFGHGNPACLDLARSALLDPLPDKAERPPVPKK